MAVKVQGGDLNFKASLDDKDVQAAGNRILKKFKELYNASAKADGSPIVAREVKAREEVVKSIEKQTAAQKKLSDQVRKTVISNSQAEIDAYNRSKNGNMSMTGTVVGNTDSARLANAATAASVAQTKLATETTKATTAIKVQSISVDSLKLRLESYKRIADSSTDPARRELYNKKIQETSAEITRMGNVGKDGFDKMGNAIKGSTGMIGKMWSGLRNLAYLIPGLGIAGLLGLFIDPIVEAISGLDLFKKKLSESQKEAESLGKALNSSDYTNSLTAISKLSINLELAKKGFYDKKAVVAEYNETIGKTAGQVTTLAGVEQGMIDNADAYVKMTLYKAAAQLSLEEASKLALEAEEKQLNKAEDVVGFWGKRLAELKVIGNNISSKFGGEKQYEIYDRSLEDQKQKEIQFTKDKEKEKLDIAKKFQKDAANLAQSMGGVLGLDKSVKGKKTKEDYSLERAEAMQKKIADINAEYARKSLNQDEAEIQAVRDKFAAIALEVQKFNANPKNKIKVDGSSLNGTRDAAIADLTFRQETEKLKIALDEQKDLYRNYEEYKSTFGIEKANERFVKELDLNKTYLQRLQEEQSKLSSKGTLSGGEQERLKFLNDQIKAEKELQEQAYKDAYQAAISTEGKILQARMEYIAKYDALLKKQGSVTPEQRKELQDEVQAKIDSANDEAFQKSVIYEKLNEDITRYTQEQVRIQIASLEEFLKAAEGIAPELRAKLEGELVAAKGKLGKSGDDNFTKDLQEQKALVLDNLKKSKLGTAEYQKQLDKLKQINEELEKSGSLAAKFRKASDGLKFVSSMAGELSNAFAGVNEGLSEALGQLGEMAAIGGNAAGAASSFYSGDILGGITQSISAISGIVKMIGGDREAQKKETEQYYQNVFLGEQEYARMMRARQSIQENITDLTLQELAARKEMLAGQAPEVQSSYDKALAKINQRSEDAQAEKNKYGKTFDFLNDGFKRRIENDINLRNKSYEELLYLYTSNQMSDEGRLLFEELKRSKDEMDALGQSTKETEEALTKIRTGTTAGDLSNALLDMFRNGKTGVQDFADFFEGTMKDAIFSTFQDKMLKNQMQGWYEQFDLLAEDGTIDANDQDALRKALAEIDAKGKEWLDNMEAATGIDLSGKDANAQGLTSNKLSRQLTEDTGTELVGLFRGQYDITKQVLNINKEGVNVMKLQLDIAMQGIKSWQAIEAHTFRTANNTDQLNTKLDSIIKNTSGTSLRGAGLG